MLITDFLYFQYLSIPTVLNFHSMDVAPGFLEKAESVGSITIQKLKALNTN